MDTELFVHFAEIAGVFVGFGALISQRSPRPADPHEVVYLRAVLAWSGSDEGLYVTGLVSGVVFAAYTLLALGMSPGQQPGQAGEDGR